MTANANTPFTVDDLKKKITTSLVDISEVKSRMRKGYASDLVDDIERKMKNAKANQAYQIKCDEGISPRHLANVLRQRIGKKYELSSSEADQCIWVYKSSK